jgi:hypothetical protein
MRQLVPPQQLWKEFQGDLDFEYDHATYWPALLKLCEERQAEQLERWVKAGKHYGESEVYIKGGNAPSVGPPTAEVQTSEKGKETVPSEPAQDTVPTEAPVQSNGAQANGNTDIAAETPTPVFDD